ncbi:hypothetical protein NEOKW01_1343 [Nematocida sp. AWRm80]|nr:hypothetical protein NEOKW01_1343 [Nematocida sp. AWRm80]
MNVWVGVVIGSLLCTFSLWPVFIKLLMIWNSEQKEATMHNRGVSQKSIKGHHNIGCIPVLDGNVYLITNTKHQKLSFPVARRKKTEPAYYTMGRKVLDQAGLIGKIDKEPQFTLYGIDWYVLEVSHSVADWAQKDRLMRHKMTPTDALQHSEVRGVAKNAIQFMLAQNKTRAQPEITPVPPNEYTYN